jgi:hypothetical protein
MTRDTAADAEAVVPLVVPFLLVVVSVVVELELAAPSVVEVRLAVDMELVWVVGGNPLQMTPFQEQAEAEAERAERVGGDRALEEHQQLPVVV